MNEHIDGVCGRRRFALPMRTQTAFSFAGHRSGFRLVFGNAAHRLFVQRQQGLANREARRPVRADGQLADSRLAAAANLSYLHLRETSPLEVRDKGFPCHSAIIFP